MKSKLSTKNNLIYQRPSIKGFLGQLKTNNFLISKHLNHNLMSELSLAYLRAFNEQSTQEVICRHNTESLIFKLKKFFYLQNKDIFRITFQRPQRKLSYNTLKTYYTDLNALSIKLYAKPLSWSFAQVFPKRQRIGSTVELSLWSSVRDTPSSKKTLVILLWIYFHYDVHQLKWLSFRDLYLLLNKLKTATNQNINKIADHIQEVTHPYQCRSHKTEDELIFTKPTTNEPLKTLTFYALYYRWVEDQKHKGKIQFDKKPAPKEMQAIAIQELRDKFAVSLDDLYFFFNIKLSKLENLTLKTTKAPEKQELLISDKTTMTL